MPGPKQVHNRTAPKIEVLDELIKWLDLKVVRK